MASILSKFTKKKQKNLGFTEKPRTREEINQEYNHHAVMLGHNATLIAEVEKNLETLQADQQRHLEATMRLRVEASKTPEPPKPAEVPASTAE